MPRIEHRHEPEACTCGQCGRDLIKIGEDVSEQLDVEPAKFFVHRHIRPQYACRACETIKAAPIPPAVIDGGMAAVGLLTWVLIGKFLDHLPLYRLEQIAARDGVILSRSTLADWVGRLGVALQPLAERLAWHLRQRHSLHADETPVPQLDPGNGKTKKAYLWAYRSNDLQPGPKIIVFDYQAGRSGRYAQQFLQDWQGRLVVDDYGGYKTLFAATRAHPETQYILEPCIELACWAHARRKFFDLFQASHSPVAHEALNRIAELYAIEAEGRDMAVDERQRLRAEKSLPVLTILHDWLQQIRLNTAPNSATAKAIDYSLKRWIALMRYAESGDLPIGRVEMWRDGLRLGLTVAASFVWQCLISLTIAPFPHPARQTGRADFPHPAFFRTSSLRVQQVGARTWQAVEPQSFIQVLVRVLAIPRSALTTSAH